MRWPVTILFVLAFSTTLLGQQPKHTYDFSLLRQNDMIKLDTAAKRNGYSKFKLMPLAKQSSISFGGSIRTQVESFVNEQFNDNQDQNDSWFLFRNMAHAHLKVSDKFELFGELNSSIILSKAATTPVDEDVFSINQLFIRFRFHKKANLLVGRQNMRLGSGRLVDVREGPNVRLSFDMTQLEFTGNKSKVLLFSAVPVQQQPGYFDNEFLDFAEFISGLYWTRNFKQSLNIDAYVLFKKEEQKAWNDGVANDNRGTIGIRQFGSKNGITYNNEVVYQFGRFGQQTIAAWTISFMVQKEIKVGKSSYVFGLKTEAISGDTDSTNNNLSTFDAIYPRGAYFGRVARLGPSNLIDIHPYIEGTIGKFYFELDYVAFWRFSINDGLYNPALILDYPSTNAQRFIGHQIGKVVGLNLGNHVALEFETNLIFPGDFLDASGLDDILFHSVLTLEIKY